jgi:hypothetical protein
MSALPKIEGMSTQGLLEFLHKQGYGAKSLSQALAGKIHYKSLHRWKSGAYKPRKSSDHALIMAFTAVVVAKLAEQTKTTEDCPF